MYLPSLKHEIGGNDVTTFLVTCTVRTTMAEPGWVPMPAGDYVFVYTRGEARSIIGPDAICDHPFSPWTSPGGHVRCETCGGYPIDHPPIPADVVTFGDGKTVTEKTDVELASLLKYWGHPRHPQRVADAIRAEQVKRSIGGAL